MCGQLSAGASSEDNTGENVDKGYLNTETPSLYMLWKSYLLKKNYKLELSIDTGTS